MKRKHLLSRIFRLLRSGEGSPKFEQSRKKFITLANGQQICISNCRRQHRTSVTSHLSHFEPMPTIHEEDDLDFEQCSTKSDPLPSPKVISSCKSKPISAKVIPSDNSFLSRSAPATSACGYATVVDMLMLERTAVC
uniref:Uncharacterized protein n=1 Tax=Syphacia muris TaxID=451379 RepID=A0A0N5AJP0_9BILA